MASVSKLRRVWQGMHERCEIPTHKSYAYYGGRGIGVCAEWATFPPFEKWALANGYELGLKLDRRENNEGYSPDNCRFVTHEVNCNNTRANHLVTAFGETKSLSRWERDERCSVSAHTINRRLSAGYSTEDAIALPYGFGLKEVGRQVRRDVTAFGETKQLCEWVRDERCTVSAGILFDRLARNWPPEEAITGAVGAITGAHRFARRYTAFGETKTLGQWARDPRCVVKESTLSMRLTKYASAFTVESAITTPKRRQGRACA